MHNIACLHVITKDQVHQLRMSFMKKYTKLEKKDTKYVDYNYYV